MYIIYIFALLVKTYKSEKTNMDSLICIKMKSLKRDQCFVVSRKFITFQCLHVNAV